MARRGSLNSNGNIQEAASKLPFTKENLKQALILFTYLRPYRSKFIGGLIFIALSAFTTSLFPFFLGKMIDAASPGAGSGVVPGLASGLPGGISMNNINWSLNTTLLLIFTQLLIQTFFFVYAGVPAYRSRRKSIGRYASRCF